MPWSMPSARSRRSNPFRRSKYRSSCPRMRASSTPGNLDQAQTPRRTGSSAFADDDTATSPTSAAEPAPARRCRRLEPQLRRSWSTSPAEPWPDESILRRLGLQFGDRCRRVVTRQHIGDGIGRHEIGQPQFAVRQFVQIFPRRNAERERQQPVGRVRFNPPSRMDQRSQAGQENPSTHYFDCALF